MGCRFSTTNNTELESNFDSTNLEPQNSIRSLLDTTEHLLDSQSMLTSEALNLPEVSGKGSSSSSCCMSREATTTPTDYNKSGSGCPPLARWDICNRITLESK
ncbi:unnamed protein product [Litomosoides sigmodontis]|uniref:Uncharacterized protein n=1 Tax=Litomosoides sigmodontis TaxID=42156 RepID=A0A3P6T0U1_LITSI|nr:unnamed protein product [Litomosoides sigmodontis]